MYWPNNRLTNNNTNQTSGDGSRSRSRSRPDRSAGPKAQDPNQSR